MVKKGLVPVKIRLTPKRAKISAAHSLPCFGVDHPCARKHGHTWWIQATFEGYADDEGILIDYAVVREVASILDHRDLDSAMSAPPTGENILAWAVGEFSRRASERPDCCVVRVEVVEDPIPGDGHVLVWEAA